MRRRQRAKLREQEDTRAERQRREAAAELAKRTRYDVVFETTVEGLETATDYFQARIIDGQHVPCRTLKKGGHFTEEGRRVYQELLAKNDEEH